jgi:hypothetical protein
MQIGRRALMTLICLWTFLANDGLRIERRGGKGHFPTVAAHLAAKAGRPAGGQPSAIQPKSLKYKACIKAAVTLTQRLGLGLDESW